MLTALQVSVNTGRQTGWLPVSHLAAGGSEPGRGCLGTCAGRGGAF